MTAWAMRIGTSALWMSPEDTDPNSAERAPPIPRAPVAMRAASRVRASEAIVQIGRAHV